MWRLLAFVSGLGLCFANATPQKALVLVDHSSQKMQYSHYVTTLKEMGFDVTVKISTEPDIRIDKFGEFVYDSIVLFCPAVTKFGGNLTANSLVEFVASGRSFVLAVPDHSGTIVRNLALAFGFQIHGVNNVILDHFNAFSNDEFASENSHVKPVIVRSLAHDSRDVLGKDIFTDLEVSGILYRGTGMSIVSSRINDYAFPILFANPSGYCADAFEPVGEGQALAGTNAILLGVAQTKLGGRVVVSGSLELFSNKFNNRLLPALGKNGGTQVSGNQPFVRSLTKWVTFSRNRVRVKRLTHFRSNNPNGEKQTPDQYRLQDVMNVSLILEIFDSGKWKPFLPPDVQIELVKMSTYVRETLEPNFEEYSLEGSITLPDEYGAFKLVVDYNRLGYSRIFVSEEIGVRPFRHDEEPRFVTAAIPFHLAATSALVGFVVFAAVFVFAKPEPTT